VKVQSIMTFTLNLIDAWMDLKVKEKKKIAMPKQQKIRKNK
jgi:phage regulator Rha-like protein